LALAQDDGVHYQLQASAPPGAIGSERLRRGGPVPGDFQPVKLEAPDGVRLALAAHGSFGELQSEPVEAGLLIGAVYRLRLTNIPNEEGLELFPTVEIIDRLYPPPGQERRFPIPIELTEDDLRLALSGQFVTRVIYVEDPEQALPVVQTPGRRHWFQVESGVDPLQEADLWGRPVAVVRLGGRLPDDPEQPEADFLLGCPPYTVFQVWTEDEPKSETTDEDGVEAATESSGTEASLASAEIPATDRKAHVDDPSPALPLGRKPLKRIRGRGANR
jgi:hypothetical protein